jgi:hypothetical protein
MSSIINEADFNRVDRVERVDGASEENVMDPPIGTNLHKFQDKRCSAMAELHETKWYDTILYHEK